MTLQDLLQSDAAALVSTSDMGETVTYYPGGHLYDPREIAVLIRRDPDVVSLALGEADVLGRGALLRIPRGEDSGKLEEVQKGADLVDVPLLRGAEPTRCRVLRIVSTQHPGFWVVGVLK